VHIVAVDRVADVDTGRPLRLSFGAWICHRTPTALTYVYRWQFGMRLDQYPELVNKSIPRLGAAVGAIHGQKRLGEFLPTHPSAPLLYFSRRDDDAFEYLPRH